MLCCVMHACMAETLWLLCMSTRMPSDIVKQCVPPFSVRYENEENGQREKITTRNTRTYTIHKNNQKRHTHVREQHSMLCTLCAYFYKHLAMCSIAATMTTLLCC